MLDRLARRELETALKLQGWTLSKNSTARPPAHTLWHHLPSGRALYAKMFESGVVYSVRTYNSDHGRMATLEMPATLQGLLELLAVYPDK